MDTIDVDAYLWGCCEYATGNKELQEELERYKWALSEHQFFNHINNDVDAYLWGCCEYATGNVDENGNINKPSKANYRLK